MENLLWENYAPMFLCGEKNRIQNVEVSDTCLPAGRQQAMPRRTKAGNIKIKTQNLKHLLCFAIISKPHGAICGRIKFILP
jgi:hypothetical protein